MFAAKVLKIEKFTYTKRTFGFGTTLQLDYRTVLFKKGKLKKNREKEFMTFLLGGTVIFLSTPHMALENNGICEHTR